LTSTLNWAGPLLVLQTFRDKAVLLRHEQVQKEQVIAVGPAQRIVNPRVGSVHLPRPHADDKIAGRH